MVKTLLLQEMAKFVVAKYSALYSQVSVPVFVNGNTMLWSPFDPPKANFSVVKGKIEALISESEIIELQNSKVTMYSKLADVKLTVDGLEQTYTDISSKYDSVSGQYTKLDAKVAEYKSGVDGLSANISAVSTTLKNDYSTTSAMNAAITANVSSVLATVSETYATQDRVGKLETWKNQAEQKITADAIVSTVTSSSSWGDKADKATLISQINQSAEQIKIRGSIIDLQGNISITTKPESGIGQTYYDTYFSSRDKRLTFRKGPGTSDYMTFSIKGLRSSSWKCLDLISDADVESGDFSSGNHHSLGYTNIYGILYVAAGLKVAGTKQAVRETENYGEKGVYCYETPTPYFGDIGSGEIAADGKCYVDIEDILKEMINTEMQYYVFLQKRGEGDLYVSECSPDYFIVTGTPGLKFFWELKAKQKGYEYNRYEGEDRVVGFKKIAYDDEYIAETEKLIEEREEI